MDAQACTILRIKRKRHEEPLEGLVIERKKSQAGGVFTFAQTVEAEAWDDKLIKEKLQRELLELANIAPGPSSPPRLPLPKRRRTATKDDARRYIVKAPTSIPESPVMESPPDATKPISVPGSSPQLTMIDAERAASEGNEEMDPEMANILPLLQQYLSVHEQTYIPPSEQDDDYVWDVFFHRPTTLTDWNNAATFGTLAGISSVPGWDEDSSDEESEVEDEADEDSNAEEYFANDYPEDEVSSDSGPGSSDEFHDYDSDYYGSDNDYP
ncbi:hypothetical protein CYLTODRAFT_487001 [Cylindrobasidium torrendii FP15055 ss-10]|uniref:Probable RNA polymerase II nuclear localization protein SLC7A6OS n=1 Tax=Cylindrobasidium torrendii FP15055 ss-10 TaxID=1314674 RepID=A0A0D7BMF0_9AGAR|nr:hypothetical protein CYLTODRAFT_487001 [Cylindrobasidium torrendii FP15055 ss-10]